MSSYVVEDQTINRALGFLHSDQYRSTVVHRLRELGFDAENAPAALGLAMMKLNCRATGVRYGEKYQAAYAYKLETASRIQAIKSLSCWLYQCAEGTIPERSKLYRVMKSYRDELAMQVVRSQPEYDSAAWG